MTVVAIRNTSVDADLARREAVIEVGLRTFLEVGRELSAIREQRLYYQDYSSFEDYCQDRWHMDSRNANRTIEASNIATALGSMDPTLAPTSVRQARELVGLATEVAAEVMVKAHESPGKVTAKTIREAREQVMPEAKPEPSPAPKAKATPKPRAPFTQTAEEARVISNEVWSRDLAKCVWTLATHGMHPGQAPGHLAGWDSTQDVYAEKTTPARIRQAATYLNDLADAWEAQS